MVTGELCGVNGDGWMGTGRDEGLEMRNAVLGGKRCGMMELGWWVKGEGWKVEIARCECNRRGPAKSAKYSILLYCTVGTW